MFWVSSEQLTERVLLSWQILTRGSLTACRPPCPHQPWSSCSYKTRTWCVLLCLRHIWPYHRFFIITEAAHRDQVWLFGSPDGNKGEKVLKTSLFLSLLTVPGATLHLKYRMGNCGKMGLGWSWTRGCQPPPQPHVSFKCTFTKYSHWLKWHLIVFAAQRMSSHTRYPFCLCQKLTSGSVTLSEALREVWKGLAGFSGSVLSCWWQMHQDKAALGGWLEPQNWSCWKLWCSHVSAQTLHGHRILVCSYTTITLALNGDVFTSYSLRFCWEQLYPSSAFRFFLAKQIMSKSSQKKSSGLPCHYPSVTFCLLSSCTPNSRQGCSRALYLGTNILPFLWKHLNWYVLFVRLLHLGSSQSSWDQQIHPDSSLLLSFPTSLQQRFLFTLPKHMAVYFPLLNFIPFLMCQHAALSSSSRNTDIPLCCWCFTTLCHQQMPSAHSYLLFQDLPEKYCVRCKECTEGLTGSAWGSLQSRAPSQREATRDVHKSSATASEPFPQLPTHPHTAYLRWHLYLFHLAIHTQTVAISL